MYTGKDRQASYKRCGTIDSEGTLHIYTDEQMSNRSLGVVNKEGVRKICFHRHVMNIPESICQGMQIEEVVFEEGSMLIKIGPMAFFKCTKLKRINLPKNVTIGYKAFASTALANNGDCFIYEGCVYNIVNRHQRVLQIPEGVVRFDSLIFSNINHLEHVILPESLKLIEDKLFFGCYRLKQIDFPKECSVSGNPFIFCNKLRSNGDFYIVDGILFNYVGDANRLSKLEIPEGVTEICKQALRNIRNDKLKIILPATLKRLNLDALGNCIIGELIFNSNAIVERDGVQGLKIGRVVLPDSGQPYPYGVFKPIYMTDYTYVPSVKMIDKVYSRLYLTCSDDHKVESQEAYDRYIRENCLEVLGEVIAFGTEKLVMTMMERNLIGDATIYDKLLEYSNGQMDAISLLESLGLGDVLRPSRESMMWGNGTFNMVEFNAAVLQYRHKWFEGFPGDDDDL